MAYEAEKAAAAAGGWQWNPADPHNWAIIRAQQDAAESGWTWDSADPLNWKNIAAAQAAAAEPEVATSAPDPSVAAAVAAAEAAQKKAADEAAAQVAADEAARKAARDEDDRLAKEKRDAERKDARIAMQATLDEYGLGSLGGWAWDQIQASVSQNEIMVELRKRDEYKARFPGLAALSAKGRAMSEQQYIEYERNAVSMMRTAGLPPGFYDEPSDFGKFIANEVSLNELNQRLSDASDAANQAPPEVRAQLKDLFGVQDGELTAFFLDPDRALPVIKKRYDAAKLSGAAVRTGFGALDAAQAEKLAGLGVSVDAAQSGMASLKQQEGLFAGRVGTTEQDISKQKQMDALFAGDASTVKDIERRRAERVGEFQGGGSFASGNRGESAGLGSNR